MFDFDEEIVGDYAAVVEFAVNSAIGSNGEHLDMNWVVAFERRFEAVEADGYIVESEGWMDILEVKDNGYEIVGREVLRKESVHNGADVGKAFAGTRVVVSKEVAVGEKNSVGGNGGKAAECGSPSAR